MGQRFIPARHWSRQQVGQFATRQEGQQRAVKVWVCQSCRGWNEQQGRAKPACCAFCGYASFFRCDSKVEAQRFLWLWSEQDKGKISGLVHHPRYDLYGFDMQGRPQRVRTYEADFEYHDRYGVVVTEDVKPSDPRAQTPEFKIKRDWFELQYGRRLMIVN